jgi:NAD(P)-dependent dehydrogenase (short-subunit alcohol dehydrogenase family)
MFEDFIAGGIHGLVHSAGISIICPLRTHDVRFVIESLQVNLISAMELIRKLECNFYRDSSVVIVSSVMSVVGQAAKLSYCSSKGAIDAAVRSLAIELAPKMIRVNSVLPGVVDTPLSRLLFTKLPETNKNDLLIKHPLGLGNPIDVSAAVCFLLSADSTHITGSNITIDGGYTAS